MAHRRVIVVGAGVVGLTCAVRLAEAGYDTHVVARDLPLETTSAVAGALWMPYRAAPAEAVARWAAATYDELARTARRSPDAGVRLAAGTVLDPAGTAGTAHHPPEWADALNGRTTLSPVLDPVPGRARGWRVTVPLVDPRRHLPWLVERLAAAGGTITRLPLARLPERGLVVNATGLSARAMAPDPEVVPVRGQVAHVELPDGAGRDWVVEEDGGGGPATYVLPHEGWAVVGGTATTQDWRPEPSDQDARELLARAADLVPWVREARVLRHRVGLRPGRPTVRVEAEDRGTGDDGHPHTVVHCYGHGGSGWTTSWGCADDVLRLVEALS